ncbi:MAG TPA: LamG domain-containing protein [Cellvibrio sp.]|nr:LamG domain-containing protein [Cellvibrio sp.]
MTSTTIKILLFFNLLAGTGCANQPQQYLWRIDSLEQIAGLPVIAQGNPQLVDSVYGKAVMFDGDGDRLLVNNNPLDGASEFTVEIIFKPTDAYPENLEPRFFHIEAPENPNRRITIELRLNDQHQWYLDTYIKSELSQYTLIDSSLVHPMEQWTHAAITYKDRQFTAFVNGKKELSAEVDYLPIAKTGKTSIGARMNEVHWFNGAILAARITHQVLSPEQFMQLENFSAE